MSSAPAAAVARSVRSGGTSAIAMAVIVWLGSLGAGFGWALRYETTPAANHDWQVRWPAGLPIPLATDRPTLVMFLHPRCPCSEATLSELEELQARVSGRMSLQIVVLKPTTVGDEWTETSTTRHAGMIPGAVVQVDSTGGLHRAFGATTSGEVFVYQPSGTLAFHGGITPARGHRGANAGRAAIESLVLENIATERAALVFGCPLERCVPAVDGCSVSPVLRRAP